MLKNAYFLEKTVKNRLSVGGSALRTPICLRWLGALPSDLRVVTSAYYYSIVELISSAKCVFYLQKRTK